MFPAVQLAALALGAASCPANLANDLATPPPTASRQLITVEAATSRATYATARAWVRRDGCWMKAGGPYTARVGRNGVRTNKREADGATPAGTFPIGGTMYGNSRSPGVSYPYVRLRCGDWWVEDSMSPAYNTFQRVGCGRKPPFKVTTPDLSTSPRAYAHLAVIEYNMHPVVSGRGSRDLPARSDRKSDERLCQPAPPCSRSRAPLARTRRATRDRDRYDRLVTTTETQLVHPPQPRS